MIKQHAVVIAGGGPTGLMPAGELALAGVDVASDERRASQNLIGSRAGGLHARTIEVLDQRRIADRRLPQGQMAQVAGFAAIPLDISDFPTRHPYGLALWQHRIERIMGAWIAELPVRIYYGCEVTGFAQDDTRVDAALSDGQLAAGGVSRRLRRRPQPAPQGRRHRVPRGYPTTSHPIAEVELAEDPASGPTPRRARDPFLEQDGRWGRVRHCDMF